TPRRYCPSVGSRRTGELLVASTSPLEGSITFNSKIRLSVSTMIFVPGCCFVMSIPGCFLRAARASAGVGSSCIIAISTKRVVKRTTVLRAGYVFVNFFVRDPASRPRKKATRQAGNTGIEQFFDHFADLLFRPPILELAFIRAGQAGQLTAIVPGLCRLVSQEELIFLRGVTAETFDSGRRQQAGSGLLLNLGPESQ